MVIDIKPKKKGFNKHSKTVIKAILLSKLFLTTKKTPNKVARDNNKFIKCLPSYIQFSGNRFEKKAKGTS